MCKQKIRMLVYFDSDEIESTYQRLQAAGVEFIEGIQEQPWGRFAPPLQQSQNRNQPSAKTSPQVRHSPQVRDHRRLFRVEDML